MRVSPQALTYHIPWSPHFRHCSSTAPLGSSSPRPPAPPRAPLRRLQLQPRSAYVGVSMGCTPLRPHPLLHCGVLHGCSWRSAPYCAHGLQGAARSTTDLSWASESSLPGTPPSVTLRATQGCFSLSHFSLLSPSCCCTAVLPFLNLLTLTHSALLTAQLWQQWVPSEQRELFCSAMGSAGLCSQSSSVVLSLTKSCHVTQCQV